MTYSHKKHEEAASSSGVSKPGVSGHRAPPARVMEDRHQRDAVQTNRRFESEVERVANAKFQLAKKAEADAMHKSFDEEEARRHVVAVDPSAAALLNKLNMSSAPTAHAREGDWKSPIQSSRGPDVAERRAFLKSIGLPDTKLRKEEQQLPQLSASSILVERDISTASPFGTPLKSSCAHHQTHRLGIATPSPHQHKKRDAHSEPASPVTMGITKGPPTLDNTRAPLRTMVGHLKSVKTMMATRALAPLPQKPSLVDTRVPDRGADVATDAMVGKFKLLQAEERDFATDVRSRQIAEEQEGTLLHFEMTQSIRRVEEIVAALERGKEFRDMAAYKQAKDDAEKNDTANQTAHEEASLDELRQVIQILLKDSSRQAAVHQKLELESRRTAQDLRDAQELLTLRAQEISELKQQLDELVRTRETLKRDHARVEQQLEALTARTRQSMIGDIGLGNEAASSSSGEEDSSVTLDNNSFPFPQVHPSGSILVPAAASSSAKKKRGSRKAKESTFVRLPVDGATMLNELHVANMIPSLASVPNGDDVTIVCTAVQSISQLWEQCALDMPTAISLHNRILLEAIPKHRGYQVKTAGEEFMVAFHSTTAAINFAMTVQQQLALEVWPQKLAEQQCCAIVRKEPPQVESPTSKAPAGPPGDLWRGLRVAMGIHFGSVHVEINPITNGYDYMGQTVNRALMLKRISHGGMAAVSKEVYERLNQELMYEEHEDTEGTPKRRSGISYAETLRRKTSLKDLKSMPRQPTSPADPAPPLCPITMAFHCKIPAARVAAQDVYCVLPMSLEDRLADIQATNRAIATKHGVDFDDVLQATQEDEQPSELENMLGTFSRQQGKQALFLTSDGVVDANSLKTEEEIEEIAIQRAGLPSGNVALLSLQCESVRNKKFLEKILAKDMELLIRKFRECVELATAPFGGHIIDSRGDIHTIAFSSIGVAVRCALAIDAELTMTEWPKWIDNYKDTERLRWYKNTTLFAGLRASIGLHVAHLEPHYDPMTKAVGYIGADSYVAFRLSCLARPGQTLIEESVAYQALGLIKPLPLFSHLVPNAANANAVAARLCVVMSKCFVGRHFYWSGLETYEQCKSSQYKSQYKRMRMSLEMEDVRWKRDATRVVAKQHVSGGITAPVKAAGSPTNQEEADANDQLAENTGAETLLGLGEKFEAIVQKADGTITAAMEVRQRDMDVINIFSTTLLDKLNSEHLPEALRDREPIIGQLEKLEHNLMVMHDVFYEGQLVAFQPFIADIADIRELPLKGTRRDAAEAAAAAANAGSRKSTADEWTDADDDDDGNDTKGFNEDDDDDTSAAIAAVSIAGGAAGGKSDWLQVGKGGTATEEDLRRRLVVLEEEVLLSHKILRNMLDVLKDWMEPLLGTHIRYIMPDDEVVSKLIAIDRNVREPYLKQQEAASAAPNNSQAAQQSSAAGAGAAAGGAPGQAPGTLAKAIPKTTRQVWRQIVEHAVTDAGLEDRLRGRGSKLLKSMESLVCRHFLFLRQYVKRVRIKERLTK